MKKHFLLFFALTISIGVSAQDFYVKKLSDNAFRVRYADKESDNLPEWMYVVDGKKTTEGVNISGNSVEIYNSGVTFKALSHKIENHKATLKFPLQDGEFLYGLGQFQDGYNNVAGMTRRLTQVNTQISSPVVISNKGYAVVWNNYALTDFNPLPNSVKLQKDSTGGTTETVNVTSTEGGKTETRRNNVFTGKITIPEDGEYSLLLDVGQKMARRHNLKIDGNAVIEMQNVWLPPTTSQIVFLKKGTHTLSAELTDNDCPVLYFGKVTKETVFQSNPSDKVDYTVIFGTPDQIIKTLRNITGNAPLMPAWALGYIHCRERFHSQNEIKETADRFISENIPLNVIVQDWQYWGPNGWNSMVFDSVNYPNPKALTDYLHSKNIRMMLSVWSKIDKNSAVGKQMSKDGYYIPNTDWIDFFNPDAAAAYWRNFKERLVPTGIDAWWQDATEPENDDLEGRMVNNGKIDGNLVRNVYPLLVNKTVYEGLRADKPGQRPLILTRSGFPGIQRYGSALWSGDVGNDWETLRRQIAGGLGLQATGIPWWTYDAGGFFRPFDQYQNQDYINRMLRWIELSVYLPLMRVHGYMSDTEPWKYGDTAKSIIKKCIERRKQLFPYIYSNAADIAFNGSTLMRPLVFDFYNDPKALEQKYEFMFGKSLLISPVTEPDVTTWKTYLPENKGGWYDFYNFHDSNKYYNGGKVVETAIDEASIPVFAKGGSIVVTKNGSDMEALDIKVFAGDDAEFVLYEDDGESFEYENGNFSKTLIVWDNKTMSLTIKPLEGNLVAKHKLNIQVAVHTVNKKRNATNTFTAVLSKMVDYQGKEMKMKFK
ncbi:MAG: DUF5110 domain-containing protein [Bacteroidales bacterium]|nr:DUF5110 domain-containing protein [Bacteroidales bacterium]